MPASRFPRFTRRTLLAGAMASPAAAVRLPRKVRVVLIGLDGHTGEVTRPLPNLPDVELAAIHDPDAAAMARFTRNTAFSAVRRYDGYRRMLDQEKPDVAGVCNPNSEHAEAILACLERKIHVIAEKPIATELADLDRIRAAVRKGPARLTAMLPMRFSPPYLALKSVVASGEIGDVIQMDGQKSYKASPRPAWYFKRATYGGTMPWIGIHMVDLMLATSGRDLVEAFGYQNHIGFPETGDTENITGAVFRMDNGGVALLRLDYLRPHKAATHGDDRLRLAGTKGIAEYMEATGVTVVSAGRSSEIVRQLPPARSLFPEFLDHVYNGKAEPLPWDEIERGHRIVLGARQAMESGKVTRL